MPSYAFYCPYNAGGCGNVEEFTVPMAEIADLVPRCSICNGFMQREYAGLRVHDGTIRTLGALADKNSEKYSEEHKKDLLAKQKTKKEKRVR